MIKKLMITLGSVLFAMPALADGIELPRTVQPSPNDTYIVRAVISTTNNVSNLNYGVYRYQNGSVGDEVPNVVRRPTQISTTAGAKRPVLFIIDKKEVTDANQLAVCMFTVPPKASDVKTSQFIANFRYCKVFYLKS